MLRYSAGMGAGRCTRARLRGAGEPVPPTLYFRRGTRVPWPKYYGTLAYVLLYCGRHFLCEGELLRPHAPSNFFLLQIEIVKEHIASFFYILAFLIHKLARQVVDWFHGRTLLVTHEIKPVPIIPD